MSSYGSLVIKTAQFIISLNTPYLLTVGKNGNTMRIFVNGNPFATVSNAPSIDITNNKMFLGYNFIGILDEVALYSSFLTPTKITNQMALLLLRIIFPFSFFFFFHLLFF